MQKAQKPSAARRGIKRTMINKTIGDLEMSDAKKDLKAGEEIPDILAGRIKRLERIEMLRDALLPKAMEGHVKSVVTIIKCDDIEEKILKSLEKLWGQKTEETAAPRIFYTPGECAAILGVTPNTIRKTIQRGELAANLTPGGHYRIRREEMGRYRASNAEKNMGNSEKSEKSNATTEAEKSDSQLVVLPPEGQTQTEAPVPPNRAGNVEKICGKSNESNPAPPSTEGLNLVRVGHEIIQFNSKGAVVEPGNDLMENVGGGP
jgi:excisionase family DNA binding protein